ncbi:MAG: glycosyltransferase family 87 protein [Anaerolineae bacterium]|nr:glycosyltransferase family 87 protein [Anaerolineae bacterium]
MDKPPKAQKRVPRLVEYIIFGIAVVLSAILMMIFFMRLPIEGTTLGVDLLMSAFDGGRLHYAEIFGLLNPPWSVLPLIPFGFLPDKAGWGLLTFSLIGVLLLSVPRTEKRWLFWLQALLLITAFPTLRIIADAQLDVLVIGGLLLVYYAYHKESPLLLAIAVLLATAKPQSVHITMLVLGVYLLQTWHVRKWFTFGAITIAVVGLMMLWKGREWLVAVSNFQFTNTLIDISLSGALNRLGAPNIVLVILSIGILLTCFWLVWRGNREMSREKLALLTTTSMLLAAYQGGNGILVPFAIGIMPLFSKRPYFAVLIIMLIDIGYFINRPAYINIFSYYFTLVLIVMWLVLVWHVYREEIHVRQRQKNDMI